jgi:hypothetical protein
MVYLEPLLYSVLQEGVLLDEPDLTASIYARNLIFEDLKRRKLITPEILDSLITGKPLVNGSAKP